MLNVVFHRKFREFFHQFDIIHYDGAGQEFMGFAAATVAKSLSKPFIIQPSVHLGQWGHLPIDHEFFRLADAMIAHSTIEKRYLESIVDKKTPVHLVFNGIDELPQGDGLQFREKHSLHGPLILFLGRKTDDKGYFLLRQAYKAVRSEIPDCHLVNIGPGDSVAEDTPGVVELGYVSDQERSDALFACSFLCVPSEGESFGLVFLEAGRASKPYLARDLELFEELLGENQKTGIRIGDREHDGQVSLSPDQLARSLISLLQSPESDLQQMGAAGRKNSRRFLWDNIVPRFEEAYRKALAKDQDA
jgi:glycosyltransferase involved in cell wall biosynthesis